MKYINLKTLNRNDTGCEVSPKCIDCPLDECIFDDTTGRIKRPNAQYAKVYLLYKKGISTQKIADTFRISTRTVNRVVIKANKE